MSRFQTPAPGDFAVRSTTDGDIATVRLDHAPGATGKVALFLPKGFDSDKPAIIMPYFHGHGGGIDDALTRQKLAEQAAKSGKNIAFVIPQLGRESDIKDAFRNPKYAAQFLDESAAAQVTKAFKGMPVVPLTYSGGYQATVPTLKDPRVKGVVMLDSMYSSANPFIEFSKRADEPFVSVTVGPSTKGHTDTFMAKADMGNAAVKPMKGEHIPLVENALEGVLRTLSIDAGGKPGLTNAGERPPVPATRAPKPG